MKNILEHQTWKSLQIELERGLICGAAPTTLGIILSSARAKSFIYINSCETLQSLYKENWFQFVTIIIIAIFVPTILNYWIEYRKYRSQNNAYELLLNVITNLDNVVEYKRNRFRNVKKQHLRSAGAVFNNITRPGEQIIQICKALCIVMKKITKEDDLKSAIFYCKDNKVHSLMAVFGEDEIKVTIDQLNEKSIAKKCIAEGNPLIINDTEKESDFYKPQGCQAKSIFVVPIYDGAKIVFLISFSSTNKSCFDNKHLNLYNKIIEEYSSRILLEMHLLDLLKQTNHEQIQSN